MAKGKKTKNVYETSAGRVAKEGKGYRVYTKDSRGDWHRKRFEPTELEEAEAYLDQRTAAKSSNRKWKAKHSNTTFNQVLDCLPKHYELKNLKTKSRYSNDNRVKKHLRPAFGHRKDSEFRTHENKFVSEWFLQFHRETGATSQSMLHMVSLMKTAYDQAIKDDIVSRPNPIVEYPIEIPQTQKTEREILTLDEINKLFEVAFRISDGESPLYHRARYLSVLIGLFVGTRNSECAGVCWDKVNFEDRRISITRTVRDGKIVDDTKTGLGGRRVVPISPILHAALFEHRDHLKSLGLPTEGRVAVLVTERAPEHLNGEAIGHMWTTLAEKAGFQKNGLNIHSHYVCRHTCFNLWPTVQIPLQQSKNWAGHTPKSTVMESNYYHHATDPFPGLFRAVKAWQRNLQMDGSPHDMVDCLGFAFVQRLREAGIEMPCSPPRPDSIPTPALGHDTVRLLSGPNIIDAEPVAQEPASSVPDLRSRESWETWRRNGYKAERALGRKGPDELAKEYGICSSTGNNWDRTVRDHSPMRKLSKSERKALVEKCHRLRDENPEWTAVDIGKAINVPAPRVVIWEHRRGKPMPHRPGSHKLGRYDKDIRQMVADEKTHQEMADELKRLYPNQKTPSRSGIAAHIARHKLGKSITVKRTNGVNIDQYADRIVQMVAERKSLTQMTTALEKVSRSGLQGYLKRHGLQPVSRQGQKTP